MSTEAPREAVRAWKPSIPGIREVFHASFVEHAYPRHTHDVWTVLIVDDGAVRYDLDRSHHGAVPSMVTLLPPGVVHDGRAASSLGFSKRVLYIETDLLGEDLIGPAVDRPAIDDRLLRHRISELHRRMTCPDDALESELHLDVIAESFRRHLGSPSLGRPSQRPGDLADALRAFLDDRLFEQATLAAAGAAIGASPTHLARSFQRAFGIAPHQYVIGERIGAARRRLLDGEPPAQVAASVGFADQAHLTRHFKRHVGTTPARFAHS